MKAKEHLYEALQQSPRDETFIELGELHVRSGDIKSAMAVYRKAVDNHPGSAELNTKLGLLYIQARAIGFASTPYQSSTSGPVGLLVEHGVGPEDVLLQGWEQGDPEGGPAAGVGCCDSEGGQLRGQEKGAEAEGVPLRGWEKQGMELPLTQEQGTGLMLEHTEKVEIY
ncbi:hypothetical protein HPB47_009012 [Ixodes persulcatus]|uniref:Uncharacterized protein n=1 Tax=Ixodes persulcatus TaxID=34615 RepID=A0AC60P3F0_IXOPE|nr:hypothetical protein HPB47_009012 [Ixodes persulcatus]